MKIDRELSSSKENKEIIIEGCYIYKWGGVREKLWV